MCATDDHSFIEQIECPTWSDYKQRALCVLGGSVAVARGRFFFRGHRSPDWKLSSTFDRSFPSIEDDNERDRIEEDLIRHFKQECESEPTLKEILSDEIAAIALAQHYGVPTRLLDWTESPYVAAFFAFQHAISAYDQTVGEFALTGADDAKVAIWALDSTSRAWRGNRGVSIVSPRTWHNDRMRNQSGSFTLSRTPFRSLQEYVAYCRAEDALKVFLVPQREARWALADLDLMGINSSSMFVDLAGKAKAAVSKVVLEARARRTDRC